ncbi:MAG: bifunctional metallophosphatase/5'-nucleotidase [Gemmatimonadetes bacterium]|nr:bifunctional metallophosphatase/5'-nucleotidase [Gemmatimonadota bacterium]
MLRRSARALATRAHWRRGLLAAAALAVAAGAGCRASTGSRASRDAAGAATVRMLLVNDVYVTDTLRDGSGGLPRVAALRDSIERATGSRVLFVLAGDVLSPSVLGKWFAGAQMVDGFNAARLDYATLGNHEFDLSRAGLRARLGESRFRWLSANCADSSRAPFPGVRGWDTVRIDGVKIGVFGTTVVRDYPAWVRCRDADTATTALVDTLVAERADLIVGLTHRWIWDDVRTVEQETRVPAILGGHEHEGQRVERDGRLVVKAVSNSRTAVLVTFTRDASRRSGWRVHDQVFRIGPGMREDATTAASVRRWRDTLTARIGPDRVLGIAPEPIDAVDSISKRESRFGNLVTDGMRLGTNADVALINAGALRFDDVMAAGPITRHMFEGVFLFADETRAVTFPLTGARLREVLETGVRLGGLGSGPYPQVSGVRFTIDGRRPSGSRIVGDVRREDGRVIAPTDTLRVTFVTYPACRNGDGYRIPEAADACRAAEANPSAAPRTVDLVLQHLERMNGRIVAPPLGRVTRLDR